MENLLPKNIVIYVENQFYPSANNYISENYQKIKNDFQNKNLNFLYLPEVAKTELNANDLQYLQYQHPALYAYSFNEAKNRTKNIFNNQDLHTLYCSLFGMLFPTDFLTQASIIYYYSEYEDINYSDELILGFSALDSSSSDSIKHSFDNFLQKLPPKSYPGMALIDHDHDAWQGVYNADNAFEFEASKLSSEIMKHIRELQSAGQYAILANIAMYISEQLPNNEALNPDDSILNLPIKNHFRNASTISRLHITNDFKILLPDYGNLEIKMHTLPKALYLLFLRKPEGIRFKELYMFKDELFDIYNQMTTKSDADEIKQSIDDLVDATNPSVNQKCARIKEAFRKVLCERIAAHYYIQGKNAERKKILLPSNLVKIDC